MTKSSIQKRKHTRFKPEGTVSAQIALNDQKEPFEPTLVGLVFSESFGGCGLVLLQSDALQVGDRCFAQVGTLAPLRAEVVWRTQIDPQVIKVGLRYLE